MPLVCRRVRSLPVEHLFSRHVGGGGRQKSRTFNAGPHRNRSCYQNRQYRPRECIVQRGEYSSGGLQSVK
jgi:hypothetical protein